MSGEEIYPGVVIGVVKEIDASLGRIKVDFPWLSPAQRSDWASIAVPMAGPETGTYFMPELDDEVLVAFMHGRLTHPFVVGFLWNGVQKPPETDKDLRVIKTPGGHTLRFEDVAGSKKIVIKTDGGRAITLDDTTPGKIEIESGSHRVTLDDTPGVGNVTISTGGGQQVALNDATASITVSLAAGSQISMGPAGVSINTPTSVSVSAPVVNFNTALVTVSGVLQASVVTASVYSPGVGNLI
jgi:uncharacterized protein involved in type VI secretion and phage assembly